MGISGRKAWPEVKPGEWYQTHTEIARKVSEHLGFQGRAVYDELCARVDNQSSETWVEPETLAKVFGVTERHVRRILVKLREMNAVHCLLRRNVRVYRVNRSKPELLRVPDTTSTPGPIFPEMQEMSGHIGPEVRESESASISYLDSNTKPISTQGVVVTPDCVEPPPSEPADDYCSSIAAAQTMLLPLGVAGSGWLHMLADCVANVVMHKQLSRRDAVDFLLAHWATYEARHGPSRKHFWFKDGDYLTEAQEAHGAAIEIIGGPGVPDNAHFRRTANNLRATARAFQYFDRLEQAESDRGGPESPGGADPRDG